MQLVKIPRGYKKLGNVEVTRKYPVTPKITGDRDFLKTFLVENLTFNQNILEKTIEE